MSRDRNPAVADMPRRTLLKIGVFGAGALVAAGLTASPAAAATKMSQKAARYQPTPKGAQRCDNCNQFQAPTACKVVDGDIGAAGWCLLYVAKH
jgi:anaerobic selenocysteine-containing dehydrogenase